MVVHVSQSSSSSGLSQQAGGPVPKKGWTPKTYKVSGRLPVMLGKAKGRVVTKKKKEVGKATRAG